MHLLILFNEFAILMINFDEIVGISRMFSENGKHGDLPTYFQILRKFLGMSETEYILLNCSFF